MNDELDLFDYQIWQHEQERTERICDSFQNVEAIEALRKSRLPKGQKKYVRRIAGYGVVSAINPDWIEWTRPSGEVISPVCLSEEICKDLCVGDEIHFNLGFRHGSWRVIFFNSIVNGVGETDMGEYIDTDVPIPEAQLN